MKVYTVKAYRALILDEIEEYDAVIHFLSNEIKKKPEDVILLNNRSIAFSEIGKFSESLEDITRAYEIDPENETVKRNLDSLRKHLENS